MIPLSNILTSYLDSQSSLESTYQRVKHHVDAKTGIIPWVQQLPTPYANDTFYIHLAKHPIINNIRSLSGLMENLKSSSSAIAPTARQAEILSICEALERWTCVSQGGEYAQSFCYNKIQSQAILPQDLHCISELQYKNRENTNFKHPSGGGFIPEPLNPGHEILWCPLYDLVNKDWKYVPKSSCYFGHHDDGHVYSVADSRGVAAGPNKEFCIWNALLELIETDAGAIWNANQLGRQEVNIESFGNAYLLRLKEVHRQLGRDLWVIDISMDISGVIVMAAISHDPKSGNVIKGFGSHPHASKALEKALMECCQMLPNVMNTVKTNSLSSLSIPSYFKPDAHREVLSANNYSKRRKAKTILDLVQELSSKGITPLIQDVTRPELGLCVMRVFGLGMRPWFDRRGPGRLYDVPVQLGLRSRALVEKEITSTPIES